MLQVGQKKGLLSGRQGRGDSHALWSSGSVLNDLDAVCSILHAMCGMECVQDWMSCG